MMDNTMQRKHLMNPENVCHNTPLSHATQIFLDAKIGVRQPKTISWYGDCLHALALFTGNEKNICEINIYDLRSWRAELAARSLSPWTLHGYLRFAKYFFRWLLAEGFIDEDPSKRLELPRLPKTPRKGILDADRDAMIRAVREQPRDLAIFLFVASTGCREDGIVTLERRNLNMDRKEALVTEKGLKSRMVFFDDETHKALSKWLLVRGESKKTDRVFLSYVAKKPLTSSGVYQIFRRAASRANITNSWSPHQWRHAFARNFLRNGGDIGVLSQILGHSRIDVTLQHYGGLETDDLQRAHAKYAPKISVLS